MASLNLLQLLQAARDAHFRRHRHVRKAGLPVGDADFAEIDVAPGIDRDAVRREEFSGLDARTVLATETRDAVALGVDDGEPWPEVGRLSIHVHPGTEFADDETCLLAATAAQRAGAMQVIP